MTSYDKSVPGMKITEVGTPDARLLRQWAADPHNTICWGLDRVADELERIEVLSQDYEALKKQNLQSEEGWRAEQEARRASESYAIHLADALRKVLEIAQERDSVPAADYEDIADIIIPALGKNPSTAAAVTGEGDGLVPRGPEYMASGAVNAVRAAPTCSLCGNVVVDGHCSNCKREVNVTGDRS